MEVNLLAFLCFSNLLVWKRDTTWKCFQTVGTFQQDIHPLKLPQQFNVDSTWKIQWLMQPLHKRACIQSWKRTCVGWKCSCKDGSAKMACKLKLIPVACSHILKLLAVTVSFLASILDQLDQISSLLAKSKWLAFVKQLTVATGTSSGSSLDGWVLARKMFLQRQQNLEPLSPLMEMHTYVLLHP